MRFRFRFCLDCGLDCELGYELVFLCCASYVALTCLLLLYASNVPRLRFWLITFQDIFCASGVYAERTTQFAAARSIRPASSISNSAAFM